MTHPNLINRTLYHGDNLTFLRGINSGTVHLVYADPPFNKNKDLHATPDSDVGRLLTFGDVHYYSAPPVRSDDNKQLCRGCDRFFDDLLYLELDHRTPRSQGALIKSVTDS